MKVFIVVTKVKFPTVKLGFCVRFFYCITHKKCKNAECIANIKNASVSINTGIKTLLLKRIMLKTRSYWKNC